jgi:hypothetical protein
LERETGFEPATFCLGSKHSTTELLPPEFPARNTLILSQKHGDVKEVIRLKWTAPDKFSISADVTGEIYKIDCIQIAIFDFLSAH